MTDTTAPERIWLNTAGSYEYAHEATFGTDTGVTWCDMPQDEDDQEYIRADLGSFYQEKDIDAMQYEISRLREYLLETSGWLHQVASDTSGLSPSDMRKLANDMAKVANNE
jgi:hypothetical protein